LHGTDAVVNCILFNSILQEECCEQYEDFDSAAAYMRQIAHQNQGRFHWINNQGTLFSML